MAAEFSRELSVKVTNAKLRNARLGYHCGGRAPYGFRRLLVDHQGKPRRLMADGDRRSIPDDHVVITHGPGEEIAAMRRIFRLHVDERWGATAIARRFEREGISTGLRNVWTPDLVRSILRNELVTGVMVFNRTTQALKAGSRPQPQEDWIRVKILKPIVSLRQFASAQARRGKRTHWLCDKREMLQALRAVLAREGRLNAQIVDDSPEAPCVSSYVRYFGSLRAAYDAIGYVRKSRWGPTRHKSLAENDRLLEMLREAHARHGCLSTAMIDADPALPSEHSYRKRFGSLAEAFRLAGIPRGGPSSVGKSQEALPQLRPRQRDAVNRRRSPFSNDDLLAYLRRLHLRDGYVSGRTLRAEPDAPSLSLFYERFGTLSRAYEAAGIVAGLQDRQRLAAIRRHARFQGEIIT